MSMKLSVAAALLAALVACGDSEPKPTKADASSGGGGGSSSSAGSATTSGAASDAKVEDAPKAPAILPGKITMPGEPPVALTGGQCGGMTDGGPVIDGCMTAEIHCGDVITGHTRGGVKKLDTRFYEKFFCTPATTRHDAAEERIYKLVVDKPQTRVIAYLDTPCANLDVAAFRETTGTSCPNPDGNVPRCEMAVKKQPRKFVDIRDNDPTTYWIVVEGQSEADSGPFALSIQCEAW